MKCHPVIWALVCGWVVSPATGVSQVRVSDPLLHYGMCDASAAVAVGPHHFVVANDEDNVLRLYQNHASGGPVSQMDLSEFLKVDAEHPEADIEGAAPVGSLVFWITSHGRNKNAKFRQSRLRFFATEIHGVGNEVLMEPKGVPYSGLLSDLIRASSLQRFQLGLAAERAPKDKDGFNIEGLAAMPDGSLLIGLRNPTPDNKALLVPLNNPGELIRGQRARIGEPILLDLGGLGVRSIARMDAGYWIIAGDRDNRRHSRLFRWNGPGHPARPVPHGNFPRFNPEGLVVYPGNREKILLLSDDGTTVVNGETCKKLESPGARRFRSYWVTLPR